MLSNGYKLLKLGLIQSCNSQTGPVFLQVAARKTNVGIPCKKYQVWLTDYLGSIRPI